MMSVLVAKGGALRKDCARCWRSMTSTTFDKPMYISSPHANSIAPSQQFRLRFGRQAVQSLSAEIKQIDSNPRVLLVTGGSQESRNRARLPLFLLQQRNVEYFTHHLIEDFPTAQEIDDGVEICQRTGVEAVVGFGGGAVMDLAKAISVKMNNPGGAIEYSSVIGPARKPNHKPAPLILVPTSVNAMAAYTNEVLGYIRAEERVAPFFANNINLKALVASAICQYIECVERVLSDCKSEAVLDVNSRALKESQRALNVVIKSKGQINSSKETLFESLGASSVYGGVASSSGLGITHALTMSIKGVVSAPYAAVFASLAPSVLKYHFSRVGNKLPLEIGRSIDVMAGSTNTRTSESDRPRQLVECIQHATSYAQPEMLHKYGLKDSDMASLIDEAWLRVEEIGQHTGCTKADLMTIVSSIGK